MNVELSSNKCIRVAKENARNALTCIVRATEAELIPQQNAFLLAAIASSLTGLLLVELAREKEENNG